MSDQPTLPTLLEQYRSALLEVDALHQKEDVDRLTMLAGKLGLSPDELQSDRKAQRFYMETLELIAEKANRLLDSKTVARWESETTRIMREASAEPEVLAALEAGHSNNVSVDNRGLANRLLHERSLLVREINECSEMYERCLNLIEVLKEIERDHPRIGIPSAEGLDLQKARRMAYELYGWCPPDIAAGVNPNPRIN